MHPRSSNAGSPSRTPQALKVKPRIAKFQLILTVELKLSSFIRVSYAPCFIH
jgi:hypothetical protein